MKTLLEVIENMFKAQGNNTINAIIKGNKIVQQKDINWSYLILGKEALAHINVKIIIQDLNPNVRPYSKPSTIGFDKTMWKFASVMLMYT